MDKILKDSSYTIERESFDRLMFSLKNTLQTIALTYGDVYLDVTDIVFIVRL